MVDNAMHPVYRIQIGTRAWAVVFDTFTALWFIAQSVPCVCGPAPPAVVFLLMLPPFVWPLLAWFLERVHVTEGRPHAWIFWPSLAFIVSPSLRYLFAHLQ